MNDDGNNTALTTATPTPGGSMLGSALTAMPTALALYLDDALYERVSSIASRMSKAEGITPKHLIAKPEGCFAVVSRAITWRLDPFAVAMATYQTPGGQIGFEGKLVHAIIENSGKLDPTSGGIRYEHYGDWSKVQGRFKIIEKPADGDRKERKYAVATWTDDDARAGKPADQTTYPLAQSCGVRVIAQIRGEKKPRMLDFDLIQAQPRNSTLWATDPMTQICYTAVRRFASAVVPSLIMGVPFDPVDNLMPFERDITPEADHDEITMPRARTAAGDQPGTGDASAGQVNTSSAAADAQKAAVDATKPASDATKQPNGETKSAANGESAFALDSAAPDMTTKASDAQRNMIVNIAKRAGFNVAQLDERMVAKYSFGIDELPLAMVGSVTEFVRGLKAA